MFRLIYAFAVGQTVPALIINIVPLEATDAAAVGRVRDNAFKLAKGNHGGTIFLGALNPSDFFYGFRI